MAAIELKNVVKTYPDGTAALDGVSLHIADGEFMILVGPSGCGKSTLLRVVAGLEEITSGDLLIGGEVANDLSPNERNFSMVFQKYSLYPHLTVYENIAFPLRLTRTFGKREIDRLVREAGHTLGLDDVLQRKPAALSGGQRQRVAMGRALVRDAQALLLDEPLSNLDAQLRAQMRAEISWLQKRLGVTTLYVTHDQAEALSLGDRVAVLEQGVIRQVDTPRVLLRHPANLFVAGFIGTPPMSFLPASVRSGVVELSFGWVRISPDKASRVYGRGAADRWTETRTGRTRGPGRDRPPVRPDTCRCAARRAGVLGRVRARARGGRTALTVRPTRRVRRQVPGPGPQRRLSQRPVPAPFRPHNR